MPPPDTSSWSVLAQNVGLLQNQSAQLARVDPIWSEQSPLALAARSGDVQKLRSLADALDKQHKKELDSLDAARAPAVKLWKSLLAGMPKVPSLDAATVALLKRKKITPQKFNASAIKAQLLDVLSSSSQQFDTSAAMHVAAMVGANIARVSADLTTQAGHAPLVDVTRVGSDLSTAETALRKAWVAAKHDSVVSAARALRAMADEKVVSLAKFAATLARDATAALEAGVLLRRLIDDSAVAAWSTWLAGWPVGASSVAAWDKIRATNQSSKAKAIGVADLLRGPAKRAGTLAVTGLVGKYMAAGKNRALQISDGDKSIVVIEPSDRLRGFGLAGGARCTVVGTWSGGKLTLVPDVVSGAGPWPDHAQVYSPTPDQLGSTWAWTAGMEGAAAPLVCGTWFARS